MMDENETPEDKPATPTPEAPETSAAAADASVQQSNSQIASLRQQQAAALAAASRVYSGTIPGASGGSGGACDNGHGNGGYPMSWCNAPQDSITTPWGYSRECVSWAGFRRSQLGRPVYAWGNANQWANGARAAGFRVDQDCPAHVHINLDRLSRPLHVMRGELRHHRHAAEQARRQGGVLAATALAVVGVADRDPAAAE